MQKPFTDSDFLLSDERMLDRLWSRSSGSTVPPAIVSGLTSTTTAPATGRR